MTDEQPRPQAHRPLIPPAWFITQYNANRSATQYRTAIDPHVLLLWHTFTAWEHQPVDLARITGV